MELNKLITQVKQNNNWKSESRIIGEACEDYVKNKIKCIRCNNNNILSSIANICGVVYSPTMLS